MCPKTRGMTSATNDNKWLAYFRFLRRHIGFLERDHHMYASKIYCNVQNELCRLFADAGSREPTDLSIQVKFMLNSVK